MYPPKLGIRMMAMMVKLDRMSVRPDEEINHRVPQDMQNLARTLRSRENFRFIGDTFVVNPSCQCVPLLIQRRTVGDKCERQGAAQARKMSDLSWGGGLEQQVGNELQWWD